MTTTEPLDERRAGAVAERAEAIATNIGTVLQGKPEAIELALVCLLAEGHLLIEDVPGVGKTSLARALAASVDATTHRIQFTPDLLPSDITGLTIYNQATQSFEFHPGGVFANIVVADELNRASPKTQSALLEVMEERVVTVDSVRHEVPRPFLVVATQNPIDLEGTYRLPEAQLDRFLLRLDVGYPDRDAELAIAADQSVAPPLERLRPVVSPDDVRMMISLSTQVYVAPALLGYIVDLAAATRSQPDLRLGVSPRGMLALVRAVRARAAIAGRTYAVPEDVKALAVAVLAHRLLLTPEAELKRVTGPTVIGRLLAELPVPTGVGS